MISKAMILAAGMGSRLGELGKTTAKCLVRVNGKTLLEHTIDRLKEAGVEHFVINTHHQAEQVSDHLAEHKGYGLSYSVSHEPDLLGTGAGIKQAAKYLQDCDYFFVHNADAVHNLELSALEALARKHEASAVLLTADRKTQRYLLFDENREICGHENQIKNEQTLIREISHFSRLAFNGVSLLSPKLFSIMETQPERFSLILTFLEAQKQGLKVLPFELPKENWWIDAGTPERLELLEKRLKELARV